MQAGVAFPGDQHHERAGGGDRPVARPFVIDGHVHAFAPDVIADRGRLVATDPWFGHLYEHERALLTDADALLGSMAVAGVDHSVIAGFPWSDAGRCRAHNDWMASVCDASGGRLSWLAIVTPAEPGAAAEAERCFALGARGIGELNADAQGFALDDARTLYDLTVTCAAVGRPVMVHATEPVGHPYPGKGTATPDRLLRFVSAFPDLDVVLAHWGGGLPFYELMPEVSEACRRVRYDTAASPYLYRHDVLGTVARLVGADRIIWGSDFPVLRQDRFLRRTLATDLSPADLAAIAGGTAISTYGLGALPVPTPEGP